MHAYLPHIASRVFGSPLLIQPRKLDVILRALGPRIGAKNRLDLPDFDDDDPDDDEDVDDDTAPGKPYIVTPDGIAIIGIDGSLVRKSSYLNAVSGLTSYSDIEDMFLDAATDGNVTGILLNIDSPGGEAGGVFDLSDQIYSQRGEKPIYAIANDSMYSAAYAIGSAADRLFITRTGGVGSVGVICLHIDQSGMDKQEGLAYTAIYAGDRKNDFNPHEPMTDTARTEMQDEVDRLYGIFTDTVARNRGMSSQAVRDTQAAIYCGPDGVKSGLADQVGNMSDALKALTASIPAGKPEPQKIFSVAGTSVAANSNNREVTLVSEQNIVADQTPTTQPVAATPVAAVAQPTSEHAGPVLVSNAYSREECLEVMQLCKLAGQSNRAEGFIEKGMTSKQVMRILSDEQSQRSLADPIVSTVLPQTSTQVDSKQQPNGGRSPLLAAVDAMAERNRAYVNGGRS